MAIDPLGREIVVPEPYCLENPRQPTDDCGQPVGDPIESGSVTLCLAYHECQTEPVPVLVGDCDTKQGCAPGTIRERYRLHIRAGLPEVEPGQITDEQCTAIFPTEEMDDTFSHRLTACQTLSGPCLTPDDNCVVLAVITLPEVDSNEVLTIDSCTYRTTLYSNSMLWDLMLCLADRVDACCQARILRYVAGNGQQGDPGTVLPDPLVVELVNGDGIAVSDEEITFRVQSGGGGVDAGAGFAVEQTVVTDTDGRAQVTWQLGPTLTMNMVEARHADGSQVIFAASNPTYSLRYVAGNGQQGDAGTVLPDPLVVEVVDASGNPAPDREVSFSIQLGGGTLQPATVNSGADGRAESNWQLGPQPGMLNIAQASLASGSVVTFYAMANTEGGDVTLPPVVRAVWPPNAEPLSPNNREWLLLWRERPSLEITFDREMDMAAIEDRDALRTWLRVWQFMNRGEIMVRSVELEFLDITDNPILGETGFTVIFSLRSDDALEPARYLIQMRAENGNIVDRNMPPLLLDAEYVGTRLSDELLDRLWEIDGEEVFGDSEVWDRLVDTGATLPESGDDREGGLFHGWFEVLPDGQ
jgi:hypothetical protein